MNYNEAISTLTRLRSLMAAGGDDSVFTVADRELIELLHRDEFGTPVRVCNCRDRYTDAVIVLWKSIKTRGTMAKEMKYQLHAGVIIWVGTDVYSNANLTDKVAAAYLKKHPEHRKKFAKVPEDYMSPSTEGLFKETDEPQNSQSNE